MNNDERNLARGARTVENLQLKLIAGMVIGFIVGVLVAGFIVYPMGGLAAIAAIFIPLVGMWAGSRVVLEMVSR